jgi:hypothetical protein
MMIRKIDVSIYPPGKRCRYTKIEELDWLNQAMRDRDKMKDDAMAHQAPDQLIALTGRLDSMEDNDNKLHE